MFDLVPLPLDWPAEVNFHEAKAFCAWMGPEFRLPTEAEEHVLRGLPDFDPQNLSTDPIYTDSVEKLYNINLAYGSSTVGIFEVRRVLESRFKDYQEDLFLLTKFYHFKYCKDRCFTLQQ